MNMLKLINLVLLTSALFLYSACGGDNDTNSSDVQNVVNQDDTESINLVNPATGIFLDSPVKGLRYSCSSGATGVTNIQGEFTCENGDTVVFFLGTIPLAIVDMAKFMTPLSLFSGDEERALRFAQLLQTLDSDGDTTNGIDLSDESIKLLGNVIDFSSERFEEDMKAKIGKELVSKEDAEQHLNETFIKLDINNDGTYPRTYNWVTSNWGVCSGPCGTDNGIQVREVICEDSIGNLMDESECDVETKPASSQSCTASSCSTPTTPTVSPTPTPTPCQNVNPITGGCED